MARLIRLAAHPAQMLAEHEGASLAFFLILIGLTFLGLFGLDRLRILLIFRGSIFLFFGLGIAVFFLLKYSARLLFGRIRRP